MKTREPHAGFSVVEATLASLPYLTLLGFGGLTLTATFGFEEPHTPLLIASAALIACAPIGLALHLYFSNDLSRDDKALWLSQLARFNDPHLFQQYFRSKSREEATRRLRSLSQEAGEGGGRDPK